MTAYIRAPLSFPLARFPSRNRRSRTRRPSGRGVDAVGSGVCVRPSGRLPCTDMSLLPYMPPLVFDLVVPLPARPVRVSSPLHPRCSRSASRAVTVCSAVVSLSAPARQLFLPFFHSFIPF